MADVNLRTVRRYIVSEVLDRPSPQSMVDGLRSDGLLVEVVGSRPVLSTSLCFELRVGATREAMSWAIVGFSEDFQLGTDVSTSDWEMVIDFLGEDAALKIRRLISLRASPNLDIAIVGRIVELLVESTGGRIVTDVEVDEC